MSSHCGRYPECGCPKSMGMRCYEQSGEIGMTINTNDAMESVRTLLAENNVPGKTIMIGAGILSKMQIEMLRLEYKNMEIITEVSGLRSLMPELGNDVFQIYNRPSVIPTLAKVHWEPEIKKPVHFNGKHNNAAKNRAKNKKARKQRKLNNKKK